MQERIDKKKVYVIKGPVSQDVDAFIYIRSVLKNEVAFSVLDTLTENPDFSECGIFRVKATDFLKICRPISVNYKDAYLN